MSEIAFHFMTIARTLIGFVEDALFLDPIKP